METVVELLAVQGMVSLREPSDKAMRVEISR